MSFDFIIFQWLNGWALRYEWLDSLIIFAAEFLPYLLGIGFLCIIFLSRESLRERWYWIAYGFGAAILSRLIAVPLIRLWYHRPRPLTLDTTLVLLWEGSYSFPSGHAAFFFALSGILYAQNKRLGIVWLLASAVVGIARVIAGVHYPSDILAGALLGLGAAYLVYRVMIFRQSRMFRS